MVREMLYVSILVITFSLVHSLTASFYFKNGIRKIVGDRNYQNWFRITYNIVSLATLAPVLYFSWEPSNTLWSVTGIAATFFNVIRIVGVIGILISLRQIDWLSFAGFRQLTNYPIKESEDANREILVTTGIYQYTRHPLYFFSLLFIWFVPVMSAAWLTFSIGGSLYFIVGSYFEEKKMIIQYGEEYKNYRKSVPWLIPFLKV